MVALLFYFIIIIFSVKNQIQLALDKMFTLEKKIGKANEEVKMIKNDGLDKLRKQIANLGEKEGVYNVDKTKKKS